MNFGTVFGICSPFDCDSHDDGELRYVDVGIKSRHFTYWAKGPRKDL